MENGDGANKADVSVSEDGRFDYSLDYRSTSSTWVDEFTVTDDLSSVEKGLAVLEGVTTAQAVGDRDGRMNVWYRTNLTPSDRYRQESCALFRQPHKPAVRCGYPSSRVTSR